MTAGLRWQQQQQQIPRVEVPIRDLSNLPYSLDDSSSSSFSPEQQLKEGGIEKKEERGEKNQVQWQQQYNLWLAFLSLSGKAECKKSQHVALASSLCTNLIVT